MTSRTREGLRTGPNSLARRFVTSDAVNQARVDDSASPVSSFPSFSRRRRIIGQNRKPGAKLHPSGRSASDLANPVEIREREPASDAEEAPHRIARRRMPHQITLAIRQIRVETEISRYSRQNSSADSAASIRGFPREEVKRSLAREVKSPGKRMQYLLTGYPRRRKVLSEGYSSRGPASDAGYARARVEKGGWNQGAFRSGSRDVS